LNEWCKNLKDTGSSGTNLRLSHAPGSSFIVYGKPAPDGGLSKAGWNE